MKKSIVREIKSIDKVRIIENSKPLEGNLSISSNRGFRGLSVTDSVPSSYRRLNVGFVRQEK